MMRLRKAISLAFLLTASVFAATQTVMADERTAPAAGDRSAIALPCANPEWPNGARHGELQGIVTLHFLVDVDGAVTDTKLIKSSGFKKIDEATITGLKKCQFLPAIVGGKAVQSWLPIQYVWIVNGTRGARAVEVEAAMARILSLAESGDMAGQFQAGIVYRNGRGVPRDDAEAARWYLKAARQGHPGAQFNLGLMYLAGEGIARSDTEAAQWMRKAAEQGHASAQFNLGAFYTRGQGVDKNASDAEHWTRKAAEQGLAPAQVALGDMYDEGRGVPADGVLSAAWYRKAAEQGDVTGQFYLAQCFEYGVAGSRDLKEARAWYAKAAAQGHRDAAAALAALGSK
ncbi:TonB family protein [Massilia sp. GCM10020059]|uniref:TonB family protein n=1 Tax=Massilia agrisoli TaxID=2892444 RepID=A0ABS8IRY1_9BURK|nr:TonB family protein [Massilia agrisoli]MCC6071402.1 TonB family protein [Massilia agrisoli]